MTFFGKRVTQLTPEDIYWLVKARVQEGSDIEFKRALAARDGADDRWVVQGDSIGDHAKRDLIKEIVGFANSRGGTLLLGIKEGKEKPSRAEAITLIPRVAELADRLKMVCREQIEPALHNLEIAGIPIDSNGAGVVVFQIVGQSAFGPHRHRKDRECYVRRNDETVAMDMHEIRRLSVDLNEALQDIEDQFKQQKAQFANRHQLQLRRNHAFVARVDAIPLSRLDIPHLHRQELVRPRLTSIPLLHDDLPEEAFIPAHTNFEWRPQLRGTRGVASFGDRNRLTVDIYETGRASMEWASMRSQDRAGIYLAWLVGMFANALLLVERIRLAAKSASSPFALQFLLATWNPDADATPLLPYREHGFRTMGGVQDGHHEFPRYEVPDVASFASLTSLFENDLINFAGRDLPNSESCFDFANSLKAIQESFT